MNLLRPYACHRNGTRKRACISGDSASSSLERESSSSSPTQAAKPIIALLQCSEAAYAVSSKARALPPPSVRASMDLVSINVIILQPTDLHWINGSIDDAADLCAHSPVEFRIDDATLIKPSDGTWTVSAAAVYLLRTLSQDHTKQQPVAEHLFPCCGNGMFDVEGQDDVMIIGCNTGIDFEVVRAGDEIFLVTPDGARYVLAVSDWSGAVCDFADRVQGFYAASSPKKPEDDADRAGFIKLITEWVRRRQLAAQTRAEPTSLLPNQFPLIEPGHGTASSLPARVLEWFSRTKH
jgi:hypothetical protein